MDYSLASVDALRAAHLICFAAGMGTGLFFDFQKFRSLDAPLQQSDIDKLTQLHVWISGAFTCLWVTGVALIYVRTEFEIKEFSPKLWLKIMIMSLMVLNSYLIGRVVIPVLRANLGQALIALSTGRLMLLSQVGILSMFGWTTGVFLGSSGVLKAAAWDLLLPLMVTWFAILTVLGQFALLSMRKRLLAGAATGV